MTDNNKQLRNVADEINAAWRAVDQLEARCQDARVAVGRKLIEAKALVAHQREPWTSWFAANVHGRSLRDAQRCMKLARAEDPAIARDAEKTAARDGMRRTREATNVSRLEEQIEAVAGLDPTTRSNTPPEGSVASTDGLGETAAPLAPRRGSIYTPEGVIEWFKTLGAGDQTALLRDLSRIARNTLDLPTVGGAEPVASPLSQAPEPARDIAGEVSETPPPADDGGLGAIWRDLKPNTQKSAVSHVERGCPEEIDASEPLQITEALRAFRAAAARASDDQRRVFLQTCVARTKDARGSPSTDTHWSLQFGGTADIETEESSTAAAAP